MFRAFPGRQRTVGIPRAVGVLFAAGDEPVDDGDVSADQRQHAEENEKWTEGNYSFVIVP